MTQQYIQSPVTIPVAALNIGDSYAGMTLRFGSLMPVTRPTGDIEGEAVQWTHQAALSPTSAVQLRDMLDAAIKGWEARFGAIPTMGVSFTKNGEAPQPEATETACGVCGSTGSLIEPRDDGTYGKIQCPACNGQGTVAMSMAGVSILDLFRRPPSV